MKKNLEAELMSLAHRILQLKNRADIHELKIVAGVLYEKLSVLSFVEKHFEGPRPTIGKKEVEKSLGGSESERYAPDGTAYNPEGITEPNTEKIKDIVAQMPPESQDMDRVLEHILPEEKNRVSKGYEPQKSEAKNDEANDELKAHAISYDNLPEFEPVQKNKDRSGAKPNAENKPQKHLGKASIFEEARNPAPAKTEPAEGKKLHQKLRRGLSFGLNERVVFVKHLFGGNTSDYDRVLSQLNTFNNFSEAKDFIENRIKPDYDWKGEEKYEKQFLNAVKNRLG